MLSASLFNAQQNLFNSDLYFKRFFINHVNSVFLKLLLKQQYIDFNCTIVGKDTLTYQ